MFRWSLIGFLIVVLWTPSAHAQEPVVEITFEGALAMARQRSPEARSRGSRARLASSQIDAASVWRLNPQISGALGPRFGAGETSIDWSVRVRQWFELGGQRGERESIARAGAETQEARSEDRMRHVEREVSLAFFSVLYWELRVELSQENLLVANAVLQTATRRHEVGDAGGLDVSVATISATRAQSEGESARVSLLRARGGLKVLLGIGVHAELRVRGDLRALGMSQESPPSPLDVSERADLRAIRSEVRQALAEAELGRANRWPNVALGAQYTGEAQRSTDGGEHIVQGTLSLALPIFDHGQGDVAMAAAREELARVELDAATTTASVEVDTAQRAAGALSLAARHFEETGLPALERAERLAIGSYEAGAVPLGELLSIRRELIQGRAVYLDRLLEAAAARAELAAQRGVAR
ncbi:MAG: cobalt-zinc-cadmium efflux system outer membrane protein [Polyangiales bacterium]|jgi:cobalt-zinc-cadmium efflux system outer membrane protein